jgi:small-conductance mechanosensitive channel
MKPRSIYRKLAICLIASCFWMSPVQVNALDQKTVEPQKTESVPPPEAIPPGEVAIRATDALDLLSSLKAYELPTPEMEAIEKALPEATAQIDLELTATKTILKNLPTLFGLQASQERWLQLQQKIAGWLKATTERSTQLRDSLHRVEDLRQVWTQTHASVRVSNESGPVAQQIESTLSAIEVTQRALQPRLDAILALQSRIAREKVRCDSIIAEIAEAQRKAVRGITARDLPIWSADLWSPATQSMLLSRARQMAHYCWADISQYVRNPSKGMPIHIGLFVVLLVLFNAARRIAGRWAMGGRELSPSAKVFDRPYASALLVFTGLCSTTFSPAPIAVRELFSVLTILPTIRLLQQVVDPRMARGFLVLGGLFALDAIQPLLVVAEPVERVILLLEILGATIVLWKLHVVWSQLYPRSQETPAVRLRLINMFVVLCRVGLVIALPAMLFGYLSLAWLLTSGILAACVLAMGIYAFVVIADGCVVLALNSWPLGSVGIVRRFQDTFDHRIHLMLVWMAVAAWVGSGLHFLGLLGPALEIGRALLGARLHIGSVSVSVGNVVAFILTVLAAHLLSTFIRFLLQEDIYPRMGVERGLSFSISSLLHYTIIGLGFVIGVAALGVNLTQVTVLAGAFGVGIGFGLQSVVNNFVSGLILLFERPINVGDTIQTGDLVGEVRRIGARASTVRTSQGGDIIVPNAQLITERVTNWTLSDRLRRIDLSVGLNYGADPRKAIQLLEAVAGRQPNVLKHPPPRCLLIGYGDSSMNFQLRAWTDQFDKWSLISSDLACAVYDAVIEAGLQFPFPQREVRLLHDPGVGPIPEAKLGTHRKTTQRDVP